VLRPAAHFHMGPSLPDKPFRELVLKTSGGYVAQLLLRGGPESIDVPVLAGVTEILLIPTDLPSVKTQPNGDSRPLLLGVQGLRAGWLSKPGFCSVQLSEGWHDVERTGVHWLRWMSTRARVRVFVSRETDLTLRGQFLSALSPNRVFLSVEGRTVATWEGPQRGFELRAVPTARIHLDAGATMIEFRSQIPAVQLPNDKRWLAVAVQDLSAATDGLGDCQLVY